MTYKVTKQYGRGNEMPDGDFKDLNEAKLHIKNKLVEDAAMRMKVIYRITEFGDVIEEFDPDKLPPPVTTTSGGDTSQQGQSTKSTFSPTPFQTSPRPPGMPPSSMKDVDEDDKDKKE